MWQILKTLLVQGILAKTVLRSFGWLGWLIPAGFVLKVIGWPLMLILGVLAAPVLVLLLLIGLPIFVVLLLGGALMALVGAALTVGGALLKLLVPVALVVLLVRWVMKRQAASAAAPAEPSAAA